jgi:hypothetical protein
MREGSESALVEDSGGQVGGRMVCSAFLQAGWAEDHALAQAADDRRAAEQTAAAQAAAAAQAEEDHERTVALHQRQLDGALAALGESADLSDALSAIQDAGRSVDEALAETRAAAKEGPGEDCYNVAQVVGYSAQQNVEYSANLGVQYEIDLSVTPALAATRAAITNLREVAAKVEADGFTAPTTVTPAIPKRALRWRPPSRRSTR